MSNTLKTLETLHMPIDRIKHAAFGCMNWELGIGILESLSRFCCLEWIWNWARNCRANSERGSSRAKLGFRNSEVRPSELPRIVTTHKSSLSRLSVWPRCCPPAVAPSAVLLPAALLPTGRCAPRRAAARQPAAAPRRAAARPPAADRRPAAAPHRPLLPVARLAPRCCSPPREPPLAVGSIRACWPWYCSSQLIARACWPWDRFVAIWSSRA